MTEHIDPIETARNNVLAAALALQQCTQTEVASMQVTLDAVAAALGDAFDPEAGHAMSVYRVMKSCLAATTQASTAQAELPAILFDGKAVYDEIVRKHGKAYCGSVGVVADTLDAVARLMRGGATSSTDAQAAAEVRDGCEHCIDTYCLLGEKCRHCGHEAESQGIKRSAGDTGGAQQPLTRCAATRDGECSHAQCPQLRDNEPATSARHCPLDNQNEED